MALQNLCSKILISIVGVGVLATSAHAENLGTYGNTYPIKEKNFLDAIKDMITGLEDSGELDKMNTAFKERATKSIMRPPGLGLPRAMQNRSFIYDPAVIVQEDITDLRGNIIATKGTVVNPLEHMQFSGKLLFFNGDDKAQVKWVLEESANWEGDIFLILTDGSPIELMRETKQRMYFDQRGYLTSTFGVRAVPAVLYADQNLMQGQEIFLGVSVDD